MCGGQTSLPLGFTPLVGHGCAKTAWSGTLCMDVTPHECWLCVFVRLPLAALVSFLAFLLFWLCAVLGYLCAFASGRAAALLCVFAPDGAYPCFNVNLCLHVGYYVLTVVGKTQTLPL